MKLFGRQHPEMVEGESHDQAIDNDFKDFEIAFTFATVDAMHVYLAKVGDLVFSVVITRVSENVLKCQNVEKSLGMTILLIHGIQFLREGQDANESDHLHFQN